MKKLFFILSAILISTAAFCQSSEKVSEILESSTATYGQAAYLASVYLNYTAEDSDFGRALNALVEKGVLKPEINEKDSIKLKDATYIFATTTKMKGGLWYSIKQSPRYALKEVKAKGIVAENYDPSRIISGRDLLDLFSNIVAVSEKAAKSENSAN